MPAATRLGDVCTGHGAFPPRANIAASGNVLINGKGAPRVGDAWAVHCDPGSCHGANQAVGSGSVFINGQPAARIGDAVGCGSAVAQGSPNVFIGG